jgi:ABC-type phosphate/phosphonate transport system substrate-binding protein
MFKSNKAEQAMRKTISSVLFFLLSAFSAGASAAGGNVLMGISEGVAEQASFSEMQDKYRGLAEYLGRVLKRKVTLESSQNFQSALANLGKERYDLMFVRPSNIAGRAIRDNKYQLVASAKGEFTASFIVRKDHTFKKPEDTLTHVFAMPEEGALMSRVGVATLRDMGGNVDKMQIRYSRYQEAVAFMVEQKFADVGVVAPAQAKAWEQKGGAVLFKSKKIPFWCIIASPKMTTAEVTALQEALIGMEHSEEGQAILKKIGVKGWVGGDGKDYVDLLKWLGV